MVHAVGPIVKNQLKLVPASTRVTNNVPTGMAVNLGKVDPNGACDMFLLPQFTAPIDMPGNTSDLPWVSTFWIIKRIKEEDEKNDAHKINLKLQWNFVDVMDFNVAVPYLVNTRGIKTNEEF